MKNQENKKYIKLGFTGVIVLVIALVLFIMLFRPEGVMSSLRMMWSILSPVVIGGALAYILAPVCNRIEKWLVKLFKPKNGRNGAISALSIVFSLLLVIFIIWVLVMLVIPKMWSSIVGIANAISGELATMNKRLSDLLERYPTLQEYWNEYSAKASSEVVNWLKRDLLPTVGTVITGLGSQIAMFIEIVKNMFIGILISVYLLAGRQKFAAQGKMILYGAFPQHIAEIVEDEIRYANRMFNGFLMGKLLDSAIIGVICFVVTTILGIDSAVLISVIVGVTNIIPVFGPFIGAIPCALLLLLENPMHCLYFVIFVIILQQLDGNFIGPKILGNSTGLSSFWVLFAILLFGGLWGILGMIIGVPLFAVIYDIVRRLAYYGLKKHECGEYIEAYESKFHTAQEDEKKKKKRLFEFKKHKSEKDAKKKK